MLGRGFIDTYPPATTLSVNSRWLFQLCVLGFRCDEDGDVGVGVFPEREEILISRASFLRVALQRIGTPQTKMCESAQRAVLHNTPIVYQFLVFAGRLASATLSEVRLSSHVYWVEQSSDFDLRKSLPKLILSCVVEESNCIVRFFAGGRIRSANRWQPVVV